MNSFNFLIVHHTASANNDASGIGPVTRGVSGLPGPLAQLCLKRNGDPHIIAQGVCWHAGYGAAMWGAPAGMGNYYSIGIEGIDSGRNTWTPEQRAMYPRVVAALLKYAGLPSDRWIFHRDYNKRDGKIDPVGFDWTWFRDEVNRHYNSGGLPPAPQKSEIQKKRDENAWLGNKTTETDELALPDKIGRATFYEVGAIYYSPVTGAQAINKDILEKYASQGYEAGELKYPITSTFDLTTDGKNRAQHFQGGSIYWSEKYGSFIVKGEIKKRWAELDWEKSYMGMPVSDEKTLPDKVGVIQDYVGGIMYFSPATAANPVIGLILEAFRRNGYEGSVGYPRGGEIKCPTEDGVFQIYEFAHAYYKHGTEKAFFVDNDFLDYYGRMGYESGRMSFPIGDKFLVRDNTWRQDFVGGSIEINRNDKSAVLLINGESISV